MVFFIYFAYSKKTERKLQKNIKNIQKAID